MPTSKLPQLAAAPNPWIALLKALRSQLHPKMLFAVCLPIVVGLISLLILSFILYSPLNHWLLNSVSQWGWVQWLMAHTGDFAITDWFIKIISGVTVMVFSAIIGFASASIFVTPMALNLLSQQDYTQLSKQGVNANTVSITNAIKVSAITIIGWLLTLPFWLIPFMPIVLSVFWGSYAFSQMGKIDAIVEHANKAERQLILDKYNGGFWLIGLVCALLALIPLVGLLVMPVYSILANTHYGLTALGFERQLRQTKVIEAAS
ncbi:EI24 domain-containing protein [Brackiella oedipodis]|uniref:EI24 domain-containing protein n=1 Tax=Brackiella oedipodis TaxID=124225 RepID=UPI0004908944|nr:EI24 domain-containing protein [Brackiella oedipodis]